MMKLSCDVIAALAGRTLVTAESCTGGGIGAALTAVPGSSKVFKGGIISYTNEVKEKLLNVDSAVLREFGAVSGEVAEAMAIGARLSLQSDFAVSVTGLAGPGGDDFSNPVGTVYIGFAGPGKVLHHKFLFHGDRDEIRDSAVQAALRTVLHQL